MFYMITPPSPPCIILKIFAWGVEEFKITNQKRPCQIKTSYYLYVRTKPGSSIYLENKKKITKNNQLFTKVKPFYIRRANVSITTTEYHRLAPYMSYSASRSRVGPGGLLLCKDRTLSCVRYSAEPCGLDNQIIQKISFSLWFCTSDFLFDRF